MENINEQNDIKLYTEKVNIAIVRNYANFYIYKKGYLKKMWIKIRREGNCFICSDEFGEEQIFVEIMVYAKKEDCI